jgi:mannose-6-phosphate isomerase-like protein (cupin superfamily)
MWDKSKTMESIIDSVTYGGKDGPAIVGPIRFHSEDEAMNRPLTPFRQLRPAESLHVHPQLEIDQRLTEIYYIAQGTAALLFVERGVPHVLFLQAGDMAVVESSTIHEVLVVGSGAYEHVAVQVPSTFHYGFRFRHSIERERFAFDKLSDQDLCNAYVFVQEHLHSSGIRSFPMYQAVASLRSHLSELDLMMVLQVAEEEKALSAA